MIKLTHQEIQKVIEGLRYSAWARQTYDYKNQETKFHLDSTPDQAVYAIQTLQHQLSELCGDLYKVNEENRRLKAEIDALKAKAQEAQSVLANAIRPTKATLDQAFTSVAKVYDKPQSEPKLWAPEGYVAHRSEGFKDCVKCAFYDTPFSCEKTPCERETHPQKVQVYYEKI